jgi:hypothetical protein
LLVNAIRLRVCPAGIGKAPYDVKLQRNPEFLDATLTLFG